jgi:hypothetical protein
LLDKEKIKKEDNTNIYFKIANNLLNYYWSVENVLLSKNEKSNFEKGFTLLNSYQENFQKRNALLKSIVYLQENEKDAKSIVLMDSLLNVHVYKTSKFGNKFFHILGKLSTNAGDKLAMALMKDKSDKIKPSCLDFFVKGKAEKGLYFQATSFIPDYVSSLSQLQLYTTILKVHLSEKASKNQDVWYYVEKKNVELNENSWFNMAYELNDDGTNYISSE